jgi:hypothetical protein
MKQYELIEAESAYDLSELVQKRLSEGWELYGNPGVALANDNSIREGSADMKRVYFQAVVKHGDGGQPSDN